eukprot:208701-Chlamydomonas_euryale.AAC.1
MADLDRLYSGMLAAATPPPRLWDCSDGGGDEDAAFAEVDDVLSVCVEGVLRELERSEST